MIEIDPADLVVGEDVPLQVRFGNISQVVLPEAGVFMIQDPPGGIPSCHFVFSLVVLRPAGLSKNAEHRTFNVERPIFYAERRKRNDFISSHPA
jgi:hypothetical protein